MFELFSENIHHQADSLQMDVSYSMHETIVFFVDLIAPPLPLFWVYSDRFNSFPSFAMVSMIDSALFSISTYLRIIPTNPHHPHPTRMVFGDAASLYAALILTHMQYIECECFEHIPGYINNHEFTLNAGKYTTFSIANCSNQSTNTLLSPFLSNLYLCTKTTLIFCFVNFQYFSPIKKDKWQN